RAKVTRTWLERHGMAIFPHPPTSPDLSPIKPTWHILKTKLRAYNPCPGTYQQLCEAILACWDQITVTEIDRFVDRMPAVVDAVIAANGSHTRY
ncbi:hypothetical protein B0H19DRAFT_850247, partial [Mycena capillaripes]